MSMALEGLRQVNAWTPSAIQDYSYRLFEPLFHFIEGKEGHIDRSEFSSGHLRALDIPGVWDVRKLKDELEKRSVRVSQRGNSLRVSTSVFNEPEDIAVLIEVLEQQS